MLFLSCAVMLVLGGAALYLINRNIPMTSGIKRILNAEVTVVFCVWLFQTAELWGNVAGFRITR
jgi:hypothetical protein